MRRLLRLTVLLAAVTLAMPGWATAQGPKVNGLGDVLLKLHRKPAAPGNQGIDDQLFNGRIDATITDADRDNTNFAATDIVAFSLTSVRGGQPLRFPGGTRTVFDNWVEQNAEAILAILFPASLTESASGIDVAQSHSQAFLLSTALAAGARGNIGGRIEYERFDVGANSGNAVQGLFRVNALAVEARYAELNDTLHTRSTNVGVNVHPSLGQVGSSTEWQAGIDGYFNALYSTSSALDVGSLDYGAGPWAAGRKEFARSVISLGGVLLGSKTHIPSAFIDDDFEFVARVLNARTLRWDLTYGGGFQYLLTPRVYVGTRLLQSLPVKSEPDAGRRSQILLLNLAYLVGGDRSMDFGYRFSSGGERLKSHAIFMNANFTF